MCMIRLVISLITNEAMWIESPGYEKATKQSAGKVTKGRGIAQKMISVEGSLIRSDN